MEKKIVKKYFCENCHKTICEVGKEFPASAIRDFCHMHKFKDGTEKPIYRTYCNSKCKKQKKQRDLKVRKKLLKLFRFI